MKKSFCSSLSRLVLPSIVMALLAGLARADSIRTFEVSGTAFAESGQSCGSNCAFSGTLTADVTINTLTAIDVSFPGLAPFNTMPVFIPTQEPFLELVVHNSTADQLTMFFTTMPNPGTLLGFTGGTIFSGGVFGPSAYSIKSGSITPIPEPGALFVLGPLSLLGLWFGRKQMFLRSGRL